MEVLTTAKAKKSSITSHNLKSPWRLRFVMAALMRSLPDNIPTVSAGPSATFSLLFCSVTYQKLSTGKYKHWTPFKVVYHTYKCIHFSCVIQFIISVYNNNNFLCLSLRILIQSTRNELVRKHYSSSWHCNMWCPLLLYGEALMSKKYRQILKYDWYFYWTNMYVTKFQNMWLDIPSWYWCQVQWIFHKKKTV